MRALLDHKQFALLWSAAFVSVSGDWFLLIAAAFNVLTVLHGAAEPLPPSIIAERIFVTRGTLTVVLQSLQRRNVVQLTLHPSDGRMRLVSLSAGMRERVVA